MSVKTHALCIVGLVFFGLLSAVPHALAASEGPSALDLALLNASQKDNLIGARLALARGADPDAAEASSGWRALHFFAATGHVRAVRALLAAGADMNALAADGRTPLMQAAHDNRLEVVQVLIESGATVTLLERRAGEAALHIAARRASAELVDELLTAGADIGARSAKSGRTPLIEAAGTRSETGFEVLAILLDWQADVNAQAGDGSTALMAAARRGQLDRAGRLLGAGADLALADAKGWRALHHAADAGATDMVELLLAVGAEVDAPTEDQSSALGLAIGVGKAPLAFRLLAHGADPNGLGLEGRSPLLEAARLSQEDVLIALLAAGAKPNRDATGEGWTPLMWAAGLGLEQGVNALLKAGADTSARGTEGESAADAAFKAGYVSLGARLRALE
ncbi:MAG: ankyrin repeat domain-containing protein [Pseudomonadota bacterium]